MTTVTLSMPPAADRVLIAEALRLFRGEVVAISAPVTDQMVLALPASKPLTPKPTPRRKAHR